MTSDSDHAGEWLPLRALLVDVGGTLVRDETWLPEDRYRDLLMGRLAAAFGVEPAWANDLVVHRFAVEDPPGCEHRLAADVAAFLRERRADHSPQAVSALCRACAAPLADLVEIEPDARQAM